MSAYVSNGPYLSGASLYNHPIILWHSILLVGDITTDGAAANRPALNMWNPDTSSVWQGADAAEQYINLANGGGANVNCLGIAKHNFGSGRIRYQLQESPDGVTWDDLTTLRTPADNNAILLHFDDTSRAFFRLRLVPQETTAPVVAHIKLGPALILQRRIYVGHAPATLVKHASRITNGSENGQYLGAIVTRQWHETSVSQENNTPQFVRSQVVPFIEHAHTGTFFFAWRPIDYPLEVIYGWTDDNIHPDNQRPNGYMQWGFKMQGVA